MKFQIDRGSGNVQKSDDDTTTQIQIGNGAIIGFAIALVAVIIWCVL